MILLLVLLLSILVDLKPVCHNNGTVVKESDGVYTCQCPEQYTGPYCESGNSSQQSLFIGEEYQYFYRPQQ